MSAGSSDPGPARRWRGPTLAAITVSSALALVAGLLVVGDGDDGAGVAPAATPATALVATGDLTISDRLDGTVVRTSELVVVHRISGQSPGAATSGSAGSAGSAAGLPAAGGSLRGSGIPSAGVALASRMTAAVLGADESTTSTTVPDTVTTTGPTSASTPTPTSASTSTPAPGGSAECPGDGEASTTSTTEPSTTVTTGPTPTTTTLPTTTTTDGGDDGDGRDGGDCATTTTRSGSPVPGSPSGGGGIPAVGGAGGGTPGGTSAGQGAATTAIATEVVTSNRAVGDRITSGDVLYSVEGRPVVALLGGVPAWRDLDTTVDDGVDVAQLETALAALGYDADGELTVDHTYDADTATAVADWQEGLGLEGTGEVALGSIVFVPEAAVVTAAVAGTGDEVGDGDTILRLGTPDEEITATVPEELRAVVTTGLGVEVLGLPGVVTRLGSTSTDDGVAVVAHISVDGELTAEVGEDVTVRFTLTDADDVLLVPVEAIASLLDGSYAVRVEPSGATGAADATWVPVTILGVGGGQAAVAGDGLAEGSALVVPG